ncbi:MAG: biopolymer transport protein ExbB/TolQ [Planctomycetaceae bacterium]|jgi:biopolymer transport protein ExbB/TolQ
MGRFRVENRQISDRTGAHAAALGNASSGRDDLQLEELPLDERPSPSFVEKLFDSPVLTGVMAAELFYLGLLTVVLPLVTNYQDKDSLLTLFCGHPLAYGTTILFWIGMAALNGKWLSVSADRDALNWKPELNSVGSTAVSNAALLNKSFARLPSKARETQLAQRFQGIAKFVLGRRTAAGLNSHLEYLAEFAGEQLYGSYALVRTITWAVPILGFLGTVIGITHAIENLDPATLDTSFELVASGLGVAFGTTALSLGLSLGLVFFSAFVEKIQKSVLADVEILSLDLVTKYFPEEEQATSPLVEAESIAAKRLLEQTETLLARHVSLWESNLGELRTSWGETLLRHQNELESSLSTAVSQTLAGCRDSLSNQTAAQKLLAESLDQMSVSQRQLTETQHAIIDRLENDDSTASLDETLHTLSAAVHLLTSRVSSSKAA